MFSFCVWPLLINIIFVGFIHMLYVEIVHLLSLLYIIFSYEYTKSYFAARMYRFLLWVHRICIHLPVLDIVKF